MAILNPNDLFDQAEHLIAPPPAGPPKQVDIRRAVSSAYYGLFHFVAASLADEVIGVSLRATSRYTLVYRRLDHRSLKELCTEVQKPNPPPRLAVYFPPGGFQRNILVFDSASINLQEKRHRADYDPAPRLLTAEARNAIAAGRSAVRQFAAADQDHRKAFLTLLLCPPR